MFFLKKEPKIYTTHKFQILICRDVRTHFSRLFRPPFQRWRSTRSGAGTGRVALYSPFLLLAFLCGSFCQRKAAKWFCYQNGYNAFSFEARGPSFLAWLTSVICFAKPKTKKLCKKKMPFFALTPRRRPLLKKRSKTTALVRANKVRAKSQFVNMYTLYTIFHILQVLKLQNNTLYFLKKCKNSANL